jgi:hypothetical protein
MPIATVSRVRKALHLKREQELIKTASLKEDVQLQTKN